MFSEDYRMGVCLLSLDCLFHLNVLIESWLSYGHLDLYHHFRQYQNYHCNQSIATNQMNYLAKSGAPSTKIVQVVVILIFILLLLSSILRNQIDKFLCKIWSTQLKICQVMVLLIIIIMLIIIIIIANIIISTVINLQLLSM